MLKWPRRRQRGLSLVEILVGLALGMLISAGFISMFVVSKRSYNSSEATARIQENGRYALDYVVTELRHANFWGPMLNSESISISYTINSNTSCSDYKNWAGSATSNRLMSEIVGGSVSANCPFKKLGNTYNSDANGRLVRDTSMLAVKRVGNQAVNASSGDPVKTNQWFLRANSAVGTLHRKGSSVSAAATGQTDWVYEPKVIAVRTRANNPTVPVLCAVTVQGPDYPVSNVPTPDCDEMIEGVEMLRIEYGVDADENGVPEYYSTSPSSNTVSATIYLVVRETEPSANYTNNNWYQLGSFRYPSSGTFNDHYRRALFTTTILAENQRYLPVR